MQSRGGQGPSWAVLDKPFSQDKAPASSTSTLTPPTLALAHLHSRSEPVGHLAGAPHTRHAHSCSPLPRTCHIQNTSAAPPCPQHPRAQEALWSKPLPLCRNALRGSEEGKRQETNLLIPPGPGTGLGLETQQRPVSAPLLLPTPLYWSDSCRPQLEDHLL